jgi:penicillin-binding protein 1A
MSENETQAALHLKLMAWIWRLLRWSGYAFVLFLTYLWFFELPSFSELENPKSVLASEILAADNSSLGRYYLENRVPITYADIW